MLGDGEGSRGSLPLNSRAGTTPKGRGQAGQSQDVAVQPRVVQGQGVDCPRKGG